MASSDAYGHCAAELLDEHGHQRRVAGYAIVVLSAKSDCSTRDATIFLMTRIGVRELRQHASQYLEKVKAGETVEVTQRGKLVALLVSPTPAVGVRDQLVASGRLVPARSAFHLPERREIGRGEGTGSEVLTELRRDRSP